MSIDEFRRTYSMIWYLPSVPVCVDLVNLAYPAVITCHPGSVFYRPLDREAILAGETIALGQIRSNFCGGSNPWGGKANFFINQHDPAVNGRNIQPVEDNTTVEITHTCCGNTDSGVWVNVITGSGIFYNVGKTLKAANKLDALLKLGMTAEDVAAKFPNLIWNGWGSGKCFDPEWGYGTCYEQEKELLTTKYGITSLASLITIVAAGTGPSAIDFISNCPIVDATVYQLAKAQGYDTIQMTAAAYSGSWNYEIQDVRSFDIHDLLRKNVITTKSGFCITSFDDTDRFREGTSFLYCQGTLSETMYGAEFKNDRIFWKIAGLLLLLVILFSFFKHARVQKRS